MKNKKNSSEKITLTEYENNYVRKESYKSAKFLITAIVAVVGVLLFKSLLDITLAAFNANKYFGYVVAALSVFVLIIFYIRPITKVIRKKSFQVDVTKYSAGGAKKHNKALRKELASQFVDYNKTVEGGSWYGQDNLDLVELALMTKDDKQLKNALKNLYDNDIKTAAKNMISKSAVKAGLYSALSQSDKIDTALITVVNLQLIKDIVFLYGYRPTYPKLVLIYARIMVNALTAYGINNVSLGGNVVKTIGGVVKSVPILGSVISAAVDSSVQGLANAVLTATLGFKTMKYLTEDYKRQEILDNVDIDEEEEVKEMSETLSKELKSQMNFKGAAKVKKAQ